jgi:hypothetical protein
VDYHYEGLPGDTWANRPGVHLAFDDLRGARSLTRPCAGPQNDFSSDERESACKPGVFLEGAAIGGPRARNQSDRMQTNKATAPTKKTCKCRPFAKRLKGFEPSTFCMASRTRLSG